MHWFRAVCAVVLFGSIHVEKGRVGGVILVSDSFCINFSQFLRILTFVLCGSGNMNLLVFKTGAHSFEGFNLMFA